MVESTTKSLVFFFWHRIDEQKTVRFGNGFFVHPFEFIEFHVVRKSVVDLFELSLIPILKTGNWVVFSLITLGIPVQDCARSVTVIGMCLCLIMI